MPSKCVESEHRASIDTAAKNGMSARGISEMLTVKFNAHISHTAVNTYLRDTKSLDEETTLAVVESLQKRVRNLEIYAYLHRDSGEDYGVSTYSIHGQTSHKLKREDFLLRDIPDSEQLEQEYKKMVTKMQDEIREEHADHLDASLYDEAHEVRAIWAEEDRKQAEKDVELRLLENAKQELIERKKAAASLQKSIEKTGKELERQSRLQALRDAKLEKDAGIDSEGNPIR